MKPMAFLFLALAVGCSDDAGADRKVDQGVTADKGAVADQGGGKDSGSPVDTGNRPDVGTVKQKPKIKGGLMGGKPGDYATFQAVRGDPLEPNGNATLFQCLTWTPSALGGVEINQKVVTGWNASIRSKNKIPVGTNMTSVSMTIELCEDENSNGTVDITEANCDQVKVTWK